MVWLITAILLLICLHGLYLYHQGKRRSSKFPFVFPLVGHIPLFFMKPMIDFITDNFKKYGNTYILLLQRPLDGSSWMILTADPRNIKHITTNIDNYVRESQIRTPQWKFVTNLLGRGIFVTDGDIWKIQRHIATPIFKKNNLNFMLPILHENGEIVAQILRETAKEGTVVDIQNLALRYTMDSFGKIGFGVDINSLRDRNVLFPLYMDRTIFAIREVFMNPLKIWKYRKQFDKDIQYINDTVYKFIENSNPDDENLVSKFMKLKDANGKPYANQWIRDIIINFIVAGRDTTALLITWTLYLLTTNPLKLEKLYSELLSNPGIQCKYLDMVINETLRMYPSVPSTTRFVKKDDVLPDGTHVYAEDIVQYVPYYLHNNAEFYVNPDQFIPERWEDKSVLTKTCHFVPFHHGEMQCLGRHLAKIEAKLLVSLVVRQFELKLVPGQNVKPYYGIVLSTLEGIKMTVKERK